MKKVFLILTIGLICLNNIEAKKIIGYYISKTNDTLTVTFNVPIKFFSQEPNYERLQWKIKYYDSTNQKKILKPDMANEIIFDYDGEKIRMLSRQNNLDLIGSFFIDNNSLFLQLIKDGKLKLFKYYKTNNSPGMYNASTGMTTGGASYTVEKYIMQKGNDALFKTRWLSFRKDMVNYLSDCPDLAKKIEDKIYRSDDIEQIIDEYNRSCK
ncbi:MAG: hypothetical protein WC780_16920 [Lentimicrobiaceae bacterium]|jgi:hypothetical protein